MVAHSGKNLPSVQETQVPSLGQEDPLEKEMATQSSILAWKTPWTESLMGYSPWDCKKIGHDLGTKQPQRSITKHLILLVKWHTSTLCINTSE